MSLLSLDQSQDCVGYDERSDEGVLCILLLGCKRSADGCFAFWRQQPGAMISTVSATYTAF